MLSTVKITKILFFLGLLLLPLFFWPWSMIPYEIPKVWLFNRWVELLAIFAFLYPTSKQNKLNPFIFILIISFISNAVISSFSGIDFAKSFWGNYYRGDGLLTLFHLGAFALITALLWQKSWNIFLAYAIGSSAILLSSLTILLSLYFSLPDLKALPQATGIMFGQPNFLAGYLLLTLPFFVYLIQQSTNQKWNIGITLTIAGIFFTRSTGGILGVFIFFVLLLYFLKKINIALFVLVLSVSIFLGITYHIKGLETAVIRNEAGYQTRLEITKGGLESAMQKPIQGWGWANFDYAFESTGGNYSPNVYVDKAHSHILEVLVTTGTLGLLFYLALIFTCLFMLLKMNYRGFARAVSVLLTSLRLVPLKRELLHPQPQRLRYCVGRIKKGNHFFSWESTLVVAFILFLYHSQTNVISISEEILFWLILGIIGGRKLDSE